MAIYAEDDVIDPVRIEYLDPITGEQFAMKPENTDLNIIVTGTLAQARLKQTFVNPTSDTLKQLAYMFPLPWDGAVHGMSYTYGGELYLAEILEKQVAQQKYDSLQQEGSQAALLTEESPSIFKQQFANLGPGDTVEIDLILSMKIPKVDGKYELVFPTMIADRYGSLNQGNGYNPPDSIMPQNLNIQIVLMNDLGLSNVSAPTHDLFKADNFFQDERIYSKNFLEEGQLIHHKHSWGLWTQTLKAYPNKDLVVRWKNVRDGLDYTFDYWKSPQNDTGYFVLDLLPELDPPEAERGPVELIILMDKSGSQSGWPFEYQKEIAISLLDKLENGDRVQFVDFNTRYNFFWQEPINYNLQKDMELRTYIDGLIAHGGTELYGAIEATLNQPLGEHQRIYAFLTDGFITNESSIFDLMENSQQNLQVFTFGAGGSVNHYFLDRAAEIGNGFSTVVTLGEDASYFADQAWSKVIGAQLSQIKFYLKRIEMKGIEKPISNKLYHENSYSASGKLIGEGKDTLVIEGEKDGQPWRSAEEINIRTANPLSWVIPKLWARKKIDRLYLEQGAYEEEHKDRIIQLSIDFNVLSPYTAFLAYAREESYDQYTVYNSLTGSVSSAVYSSSASVGYAIPIEENQVEKAYQNFGFEVQLDHQVHSIQIEWPVSDEVQFISIFDLSGKLMAKVPASQLKNGIWKWTSSRSTAQTYIVQIIGRNGVDHQQVFF